MSDIPSQNVKVFPRLHLYYASPCCQDETESRVDGRGDSAVSKGTADSGVVMENTEIPVLPGSVPRMLPALQSVSESEADKVTEDGE